MYNDAIFRKLNIVLIAAIMSVSVIGCGNSVSDNSNTKTNTVAATSITSDVTVSNTSNDTADVSDVDSSTEAAEVTSNDSHVDTDVFNPEYFDDDNFRQLNVTVYVPELYTLDSFNREIKANGTYTAYDDSVDLSHIETAYIAPVLSDGTTYMSIYDYTYVYSDDRMTEAFMNLIADNISLRNKLMSASEYTELVDVYNTYKDSSYDVNTYVYHYIVDYIDMKYGKKLFDYDFYCETYPMLALLFKYDEEALKQHFYSIGMFEGRQGCESFNVDHVTDDNDDFATYYISYVTGSTFYVSTNRTNSDKVQIRLYDPAFESYILDVAPDHKSDTYLKDMPSAYIQSELNAIASIRAQYELGHFELGAHELMYGFLDDYMSQYMDVDNLYYDHNAENKYTVGSYTTINILNSTKVQNESDSMIAWRRCDKHYATATNDRWIYVGQGHVYTDYNPNEQSTYSCKAHTIFTMTFALYWDEGSYFDNFAKSHVGY